jgi:dihydroorotate dehydrogenase
VLSTSEELRLSLRWIAILYGRVGTSLAATTGVHAGLDAAKVLLAGADVAMMTSACCGTGPRTSPWSSGSCGPSWPSTTRSASSGAA